jgi:hypothetical protein
MGILSRIGNVLRIAGPPIALGGLTAEGIVLFLNGLEQQQALKVSDQVFKDILDQMNLIDTRLKQGDLISKEDAAELREELDLMHQVALGLTVRIGRMDARTDWRIKLMHDTGRIITRAIEKLDDDLTVASTKEIKDVVSQGEVYLTEKLGERKSGYYWELSTGFSWNLNPMFAFMEGKWKVRWKKSDPWWDVDSVIPPSGKGEAQTKEILEKLSELNQKIPEGTKWCPKLY